jgi:hypothetical protein
VNWHCDWAHVAVPTTEPPAGGRHCAPHVPQLSMSSVRSKQPGSVGQATFGDVHGAWHCPALQMSPVMHMCPQLPQLVQSVCVLASHMLPPPLLLPLPLLLDESARASLPDSTDASLPPDGAPVSPLAQARKDATAPPPPSKRTVTSVVVRER